MMVTLPSLLFVFVLAHTVSLGYGTDYYFYITTSPGAVCPEGVPNCSTLNEYFQAQYVYQDSDSVFLELETGNHTLNSSIDVSSNRTSIFVWPANSTTTTISSRAPYLGSDSIQLGLHLFNTVFIQNVTFAGCELYISHVNNLTLNNLTFLGRRTRGLTLSSIVTATILSSTFVGRDSCCWYWPSQYINADFVQQLLVSRCSFQNNWGGCIYSEDCHLTVEHSTFEHSVSYPTNDAWGKGGAITATHFWLPNHVPGADSLNITNSTFTDGQSAYGGAVYVRGPDTPVWISGSNFTRNSATHHIGDAVYIDTGSSVVFKDTHFEPNTAQTIYITGTTDVRYVTSNETVAATTEAPITHETEGPLTTTMPPTSTENFTTSTPLSNTTLSTTEITTTKGMQGTDHYFYITTSPSGTVCPEGVANHSKNYTCYTLSEYLNQHFLFVFEDSDNVYLELESGNHTLNYRPDVEFDIDLKMSNGMSIKSADSTAEVHCSPSLSIVLSVMHSLVIQNVNFTSCDLGIFSVSIVTLDGLKVSGLPHKGTHVNLYTLGTVVVSNSSFVDMNSYHQFVPIKAIYIQQLLFTKCTFRNNQGGCIHAINSPLTVEYSTFENNTNYPEPRNDERGTGGAIAVTRDSFSNEGGEPSLNITNCTFVDGRAAYGGAVYVRNQYAPVWISASNFTGNNASQTGQAVYIDTESFVVFNNNRFEPDTARTIYVNNTDNVTYITSNEIATTTEHYFYITTSPGTICPEGVANHSKNYTCLTLYEYMQAQFVYKDSDNIYLELESGNHTLNFSQDITFDIALTTSNKTSIKSANSTATVHCPTLFQIMLREMYTLVIQNLNFISCGLNLNNINIVTLDDLKVSGLQDRGIDLNSLGTVMVSNSSFVEMTALHMNNRFSPFVPFGAVYIQQLLFIRCTFKKNHGGCIHVTNSALTVEHSTFENNTNYPENEKWGTGGAITLTRAHFSNAGGGPSLNITNCTFVDGQAAYGGAVYVRNQYAPVWISESIFVGNSATQTGQAVYIDTESFVVFSDNRFEPDTAQTVYVTGTDDVTYITSNVTTTTTEVPVTHKTEGELTTATSTPSTEGLTTSTPSTDTPSTTEEVTTTQGVHGTNYYYYITTSSSAVCPEEVTSHSNNYTCLTLNEYCQAQYQYEESDNIFLELESGTHILDLGTYPEQCSMSGIKSALITAINSTAAVVCMTATSILRSGLRLSLIHSVLVQNINFTRCDLRILGIRNLTLNGLIVSGRSEGVELSFIGNAVISNSSFIEMTGDSMKHFRFISIQAYYISQELLFTNCTFQSNQGGGVYCSGCMHLRVEHSTFENNTNYPTRDVWGIGGAITIDDRFSKGTGYTDCLNITSSSFVDGRAAYGGAVYVSSPGTPVWISGSIFTGNNATHDIGDALYIDTGSSVVLSNNNFEPNTDHTVFITATTSTTEAVVTTTQMPLTQEPTTTTSSTEDLSTTTSTPSTEDLTTTTSTSSTEDLTTTTSTPSTVDLTTTTSTPSTENLTTTSTTSTPSTVDLTTTTSTPLTEDLTTTTSTPSTENLTTTSTTSTPSTVDLTTTTSTPSTVDLTTTTSTPSTEDLTTTTSTPSTVDLTNSTFIPSTENLTTTTITPSTNTNSTTEALTPRVESQTQVVVIGVTVPIVLLLVVIATSVSVLFLVLWYRRRKRRHGNYSRISIELT